MLHVLHGTHTVAGSRLAAQATALLDARTMERQRWQTTHDGQAARSPASPAADEKKSVMGDLYKRMKEQLDDPQKGSKLQQRVTEAEHALEETKGKWEAISGSVSAEASAFHATTNADFARGLRAHVQQQLDFESEKQRVWSELLRVFQDAGPALAIE